jgi:hypothetical protein
MSALEVDGRRPAVAWVSELPVEWLTPAERLVLFAIACDSYDGLSAAPGNPNLVAWTGLAASYLRDTVARLCEPTPKRPALLRKEDNKGGRHGTLVFIRDAQPASTVGTLPDAQTASTVGTLPEEPAYKPASTVGTKPAYKPASTVGTSLSLKDPSPPTSLRSADARAEEKPRATAKKGTRLPDGWVPPREVIEQMRAECPAIDLQSEHRKFVDYWIARTGQGATKLDWAATWRNWIRKAAEQGRRINGDRRPRHQQETEAYLQWAMEDAAALDEVDERRAIER